MVLPFQLPRKRIVLALLLSTLLFVILQIAIYAVIPSGSSIILTAGIDHFDQFQVYFWNGLRKPVFLEKYSFRSFEIEQQDKIDVPIRMGNAPVRKIRIDVGNKPGVVKLYQIQITSHFTKAVTMLPKEILATFTPGKEDVSMQLKDGYVEVVSKNDDPYIISQKPLLKTNPLFFVIISIFIALVFFVFLLEFDITKFPAFQDIYDKGPSRGPNIDALDGLRGLAAIMVVGDHTYGRFTGLGAGGVWIFMAMSGFLLARQFVNDPSRALSAKYLGRFFLRRAQRIIPIYYFYITIVFLLTTHFTAAIMHYLFFEGRGHLWVIPQEVLFYLSFPLIMSINHLIFRNNFKLIVINLLLMVLLVNNYLTTEVLSLYGMFQQNLRLYIGVFLSGILFSYIYYGIYEPSKLAKSDHSWLKNGFSTLSLILLLFFILGSTERVWGGTRVFAQLYFPWFGAAAGLLIFSIVASGNTFMVKILSWNPLRALSIVTLSLYLFHPLVLGVIQKGSHYFFGYKMYGLSLFFSTLIVSYFVACLTYTFIEKPLKGTRKT